MELQVPTCVHSDVAESSLHQEPRVSIAAKLARALGVSLDVLANTYGDVMRGQDTAGSEQENESVAVDVA